MNIQYIVDLPITGKLVIPGIVPDIIGIPKHLDLIKSPASTEAAAGTVDRTILSFLFIPDKEGIHGIRD